MNFSDPIKKALLSCDKEDIVRTGLIQDFGFIVVVTRGLLQVTHASENLSSLECEKEQIFKSLAFRNLVAGKQVGLKELFEQGCLDKILALIPNNLTEKILPGYFTCGDWRFSILPSSDKHFLIEFEKSSAEIVPIGDEGSVLKLVSLSEQVSTPDELEAYYDRVVQAVAAITSHERVMLYKFHEDLHGEVVREYIMPEKRDSLSSYEGLHFPASDIPSQARTLYKVNRLRLVADVNATPVPIFALTGGGKMSDRIDLSLSQLRSLSPVHVRYLQNMGVGSSTSISIVVDGELWGLVACHSENSCMQSFETRKLCMVVSGLVSSTIAEYENRIKLDNLEKLRVEFNLFLEKWSPESVLGDILTVGESFLKFIDSDFIAVFDSSSVVAINTEIEFGDCVKIIDFLDAKTSQEKVFFINSFEEFGLKLNSKIDIAGVLAMKLSADSSKWIFWFRSEYSRSVRWAGKPDSKEVVTNDSGEFRLNPRSSFDEWTEIVSDFCTPWTKDEIQVANNLSGLIGDLIVEKLEIAYLELAEAKKKIEDAKVEFEDFVTSISHDLNSPLITLKYLVHKLVKSREKVEGLSDEFLKDKEELTLLISKILGMVQELVRFNKIGRVELCRKEVSLLDILKEVQVYVCGRFSEFQSERITHNFNPEIIHADPNRMEQILSNLIINSIKYSGNVKKLNIHISSEVVNDKLIIVVQDNGKGFSSDIVGKAFKIFNQGKNAISGSGVGLAVVKRIAKMHGGDAYIDKDFKGGARILIELPI